MDTLMESLVCLLLTASNVMQCCITCEYLHFLFLSFGDFRQPAIETANSNETFQSFFTFLRFSSQCQFYYHSAHLSQTHSPLLSDKHQASTCLSTADPAGLP